MSVRPGRPRLGIFDGSVVDVAAVLVLTGVAILIRWLALPTDGLLYDDAWVVIGASKGSLRDLPAVSTNHQGFTLVLMGWARAISRNSDLFVTGPFLVGSALPAVGYWALRVGRVGRAVSFGAAALLLSAPFHVMYSGRVKPYVIESLVGVFLVGLLPRLASRTWGWRTAAAWLLSALVLGTLSGLTLIVTAVAALVLVAHPAGDRRVRVVTVGVQGLIQVVYLRWVQSNFAASRLADDWETTYDSYIEVKAGPWSVVQQIAAHTARLGQSLVDTGKVPGLVIALVAAAGIAHVAVRSGHRVAARFLAACWAVALVGGFVRQVPYGPKVENAYLPGGRATIWLLPSLVFGVAWAVDGVVRAAARRRPFLAMPFGVVVASAGLVVAVIGVPGERTYPPMGTRTAVETISRFSDRPTVTLVLGNGTAAVASQPGVETTVVADRSNLTGFQSQLTGHRFVSMPSGPDLDVRLAELVDDADQVILFDGMVGFADNDLPTYEAALARLGYRSATVWMRGVTAFQVWVRDGA